MAAKPDFHASDVCRRRKYCRQCRTQPKFREAVRRKFEVPADFDTACALMKQAIAEPRPVTREPKMPPLAEQARNLAGAAGRVAQAALTGESIAAPRAVLERRRLICSRCSAYSAKQQRCAVCGCFIEAKARLATEKCPHDFWEKPEGQPRFNQTFVRQARAAQQNIVCLNDFAKHRVALLALPWPAEARLRDAYKRLHSAMSGCRSCKQARYTREFGDSLLHDLRKTPALIAPVRALMRGREYIMSGNTPVAWDDISKAKQ